MTPAKNFDELLVWKKSHQFVLLTYGYSAKFPKTELFGLSSQFRRAAVSIAANIAEGFRKVSKRDKLRFYNIAQGSLEECRYYILLGNDLGYGNADELKRISDDVGRLLNAYMTSIRQDLK